MSKEVLLAASHVSRKVDHMVTTALLLHLMVVLEIFTSDSDASTKMNDLGTLMLGGFILALIAAVALAVVRLRLREKKPAAAQFISINSRDHE